MALLIKDGIDYCEEVGIAYFGALIVLNGWAMPTFGVALEVGIDSKK